MKSRALVTGGAGFIGSHLVDLLLREGYRVRVLDSLLPQAHPTGQPRYVHAEAEFVHGDVRDEATVDQCLDDVELVFHLAGMVGNGQSMYDLRRYTDVNAVGTASLWEGLLKRRAQFARVVVSSSMVVYGDGAYACKEHGVLGQVKRPMSRLANKSWEPVCPTCEQEVAPVATPEDHPQRPTSPYGISKHSQEWLSLVTGQAFGVPTIALRYLNTYGSRQALSNPYTGVIAIMLSRLLNGKPPTLFEDGQQLRDFIHVSDVAKANLCAAVASSPDALYLAYNVGTGRSTPIAEIAKTLAERAKVAIDPMVTGEFRSGDIRHCFADTRLAAKHLQFRAQCTLEAGFDELLEWGKSESPTDNTESANAELRKLGLIGVP
jgi:dTDP-L-rhamnose 4-epimerase